MTQIIMKIKKITLFTRKYFLPTARMLAWICIALVLKILCGTLTGLVRTRDLGWNRDMDNMTIWKFMKLRRWPWLIRSEINFQPFFPPVSYSLLISPLSIELRKIQAFITIRTQRTSYVCIYNLVEEEAMCSEPIINCRGYLSWDKC